jgi:hypothetical protein
MIAMATIRLINMLRTAREVRRALLAAPRPGRPAAGHETATAVKQVSRANLTKGT